MLLTYDQVLVNCPVAGRTTLERNPEVPDSEHHFRCVGCKARIGMRFGGKGHTFASAAVPDNTHPGPKFAYQRPGEKKTGGGNAVDARLLAIETTLEKILAKLSG